jgi:hypothetical protein
MKKLMDTFTVAFAGSSVDFSCDSAEPMEFLSLLFADIATPDGSEAVRTRFLLEADSNGDDYLLSADSSPVHRGPLDTQFAAHLYDTVIFHLLNENHGGIALHAGAVVCDDRTVLLPGQSGAGKSTLTAWLASRDCSYLTDELVYFNLEAPYRTTYFSRPLCLKTGSLHLLDHLINKRTSADIVQDRHGAIIPHRLINPEFRPTQTPPALVILPGWQAGASPDVETISTARLTTLLMGCHANARNLTDHGFKQILEIARRVRAYRLTYDDLQDAEMLIDQVLDG